MKYKGKQCFIRNLLSGPHPKDNNFIKAGKHNGQNVEIIIIIITNEDVDHNINNVKRE